MIRQSCSLCSAVDPNFRLRSRVQLATFKSMLFEKEYDFGRCSLCGMGFLSTELTEEEVLEAYDESYTPHLGERLWGRYQSLVHFSLKRTALRQARWIKKCRAETLSSPSVLDYGCGEALFLDAFASSTPKSFAVGLDPFFGEERRTLRLKNGSVVHRLKGDLSTLGQAGFDKKFDFVSLWHVVEHVQDPVSLLQNLRLVCKPNGLLILETPNFDHWARKIWKGKWPGLHTPRHFHIHTKASLSLLLKEANWEPLVFRNGGFLGDYTFLWLMRLDLVLRRKNFVSLEKEMFSFVFFAILLSPLIWIFGLFFGRGTLLVAAKMKEEHGSDPTGSSSA